VSEDVDRLHRRLERERAARREAERLLEDKSRELWRANQRLSSWASQLETQVQERTGELQDALRQAEEHSQAKSRFLAMMSHEIRTPLHGILGMVDVLDQGELDEQQREYTSLIRGSGSHLLTLINDILDLSRVEAGQLDLGSQPFSLRGELDGIVRLLGVEARERGLDLRVVVDADLPDWVTGDAARLRQIVLNVAANALKFTPEGSVTLLARPRRPTDDDRTTVEIDVEDTGIGLPDDAGDFLFAPFEQGDATTTRLFGGSGLGLAITRRLVEAMGGEITWSSEPGAGTRFRITLPLPEAEAPSPVVPSETCTTCSLGDGLTVLVVDDNSVNRLVATRLAERMGHTTEAAEDGPSALALLHERPFDVVLLDVRMPGMDGLEVTRTLRGLPLDPQPFVIAMTAGAYADDERECLDAGMDAFLTKPFKVDDLRSLLCSRCLVAHSG
jgi:two-component system, sensor histidine kinase